MDSGGRPLLRWYLHNLAPRFRNKMLLSPRRWHTTSILAVSVPRATWGPALDGGPSTNARRMPWKHWQIFSVTVWSATLEYAQEVFDHYCNSWPRVSGLRGHYDAITNLYSKDYFPICRSMFWNQEGRPPAVDDIYPMSLQVTGRNESRSYCSVHLVSWRRLDHQSSAPIHRISWRLASKWILVSLDNLSTQILN